MIWCLSNDLVHGFFISIELLIFTASFVVHFGQIVYFVDTILSHMTTKSQFYIFLLLVFCAIVSHPADTIVSYMNKSQGSTVGSAAKALGFKGMWAGLGPRIIMIGTLTALQWFIYDFVKVTLRLPRPPPPQVRLPLQSRITNYLFINQITNTEN